MEWEEAETLFPAPIARKGEVCQTPVGGGDHNLDNGGADIRILSVTFIWVFTKPGGPNQSAKRFHMDLI